MRTNLFLEKEREAMVDNVTTENKDREKTTLGLAQGERLSPLGQQRLRVIGREVMSSKSGGGKRWHNFGSGTV